MSESIISTFAIMVSLALFIGALAYTAYLAWFKPSKFKEGEVKRVKDWWPFANSFK